MHDENIADWSWVDRALTDAMSFDAEARASAWNSMMWGELVVVARSPMRARTVFLARPRRPPASVALDTRARAVAALVGRGCAYKEIAFELGLSNASVWRALTAACRALGLEDRMELAVLAAGLGPSPAAERRSVRSARVSLDRVEHVAIVVSLAESPLWSSFSEAEQAVAELALAGHPGLTIAALRGARSARTVANQLDHVFRKAGVSGRVQLANRLIAG